MKFGKTAKAVAIAIAVSMSSQVMAANTNQWWSFNFDDVANTISTLTNADTYAGVGVWTTEEGDLSSVTNNLPAGHSTSALKLDTQGNNLTWEPSVASTSSVVLVDADIYLVGSDTAPAGFDTDELNPVQTAVYLKNILDDENEPTNSVLCAYIGDSGTNKWIELGGSMVDTNWYNLRIEVDYSGLGDPTVKFIVGGIVKEDSAFASSFTIANYDDFNTTELKKVNSVSFRGTGAVDNFVGNQVVPSVAATLTFDVTTFVDNIATVVESIAGNAIVEAGQEWWVTFQEEDGNGNFLNVVRVYTNGAQYADYTATYNNPGDWTFEAGSALTWDGVNEGVKLTIPTTGLTVGLVVEAYYGEAPTVADNKTVTFDINTGDAGSMTPQTANMATALTANSFTKVDYTFTGWNTASDGTGTGYADQAVYNFTDDVTLYAQWTLTEYTVTFNGNGNDGGSMAAQSASATTALTANGFTYTGYTFAGWNTVSDGSGTDYADEANYDFDADITLYAQWTEDAPAEYLTFSGTTNLVFTSITIVDTTATVGFTASGTVNVEADATLWALVSETVDGTATPVEATADATSESDVITGTLTIDLTTVPGTPDTLFISGIGTVAPLPPPT